MKHKVLIENIDSVFGSFPKSYFKSNQVLKAGSAFENKDQTLSLLNTFFSVEKSVDFGTFVKST